MTKVKLIAVGSPFTGIMIYGPFANDIERSDFTDHSKVTKDVDWWYVEAVDPASVPGWRRTEEGKS